MSILSYVVILVISFLLDLAKICSFEVAFPPLYLVLCPLLTDIHLFYSAKKNPFVTVQLSVYLFVTIIFFFMALFTYIMALGISAFFLSDFLITFVIVALIVALIPKKINFEY